MHATTRTTIALTILTSSACALAACSGASAKADEALEAAARTDGEALRCLPEGARTLTLPEQPCVEWVGTKTGGKHDGGFGACAGKVFLAADGGLLGIEVTVDATSLFSDNPLLTMHLKSDDFFGVDTFPVASFTSTAVEALGEGVYEVTGTFDVHGVTHDRTFTATSRAEGDGWSGDASLVFLRSDHEISYVSEGEDDPISDEVATTVTLTTSP